ncbi:MAG: alpha-1,4-glucan--maltose-1-phosphate maltosyltransferase [Phycisphaerae bacterium]|nr:alpha-1,4-glucan--maltose-1-phosphate maltosyltransferase [Phycisphaerae bacterium]
MSTKASTSGAADLQDSARAPLSSSTTSPRDRDGRVRVVIEAVTPSVPDGRFPVKRTTGEIVSVEADVFGDGHDVIAAVVRHRRCDADAWAEVHMAPLVNDRWNADFLVSSEGPHEFVVEAWVDHFGTWLRDLRRRAAAGQDLASEFLVGAALIEQADRASPGHADLRRYADRLRALSGADHIDIATDERLAALMAQADVRRHAVRTSPWPVWVDRERARFSSWYELFPRSTGPRSTGPRSTGESVRVHGSFRDVIPRLDDIAAMGFDVLYLPPIHPIGRTFRKGKNNTLDAGADDVGSPWAIGGPQGGHDAIHPQLGTVDDFRALVRAAAERGIEIALDLALQCSPDHPYVKQHPEWFKHRPDGSIQYAENPPKKYQDIYPFEFECDEWQALWDEILRVVLLWVERGVRIFRVDNPHTKPFGFWEWLIAEVKRHDAGVLFLAEAFTRPKVMHRLAKLGFTQSYTYFTWRNDPWELREYFTELTATEAVEYYRPNAWPNTPDILPEYLQTGSRSAFIVRATLAATLCASWGVYGPAFELLEHRPVRPGSEEYLDSEKYQLRQWSIERPDSIAPLVAALNRARRENPALQQDRTLTFHACDNPAILCYSKSAEDNVIVVAVNTDPRTVHWGRVTLDLATLALTEDVPYQLHDLLTGVRYRWLGRVGTVGLDPSTCPVHVFRVRRHLRTEAQFEYFV